MSLWHITPPNFYQAYFILNLLICALASGVQHLLFLFYSIVLNSMKETQNKRPGSISHKYWMCSVESISILLLSKLLPVSTKVCCRMHITPSPGRLPTHGLTSLVRSNGTVVLWDGSSAGWLELPTLHQVGCWGVPHSGATGRNSHLTPPHPKENLPWRI